MYLIENSKASTKPPVICGRSLVHRHLDARRKAAVAAQILAGEVAITLSARQLAQLVGVSAPYIHAALQLSATKRQAIAEGKDTSSFAILLKPPPKLPVEPLMLPKPVSDAALISIIKDAGLDRALEAACAVERSAAA
jgi:hypothetical protein